MTACLLADNFRDRARLSHGFFTRQGGVSSGVYESLNCGFSPDDDPAHIAENRRRVAAHMGVTADRLLSCAQVHSPDVVTAEAPWPIHGRPSADAMVTAMPGLALGILTADCVPVLLADIGAGVIGAAHAGWRGALTGVLDNTLAAMEKLGARRQKTEAALGACIWQNSYEVGPEFPAPFLAENPDHTGFFRPAFRSDRTLFDLPGYVVDKLRRLGLAHVEPSPADTLPDEQRFFSYRRNTLRGQTRVGSLISVIVLNA